MFENRNNLLLYELWTKLITKIIENLRQIMQWLAKVLGQTSDIMNNNCENNDTNTKDLTKTIKLLSTIKGTTHIIPIPLAPGSHPSMPINYLNTELNTDFETNSSSPYLAYISYTGRVGCVWVTAIRYLCDEHRAVELFVTKLIAIGSQYGVCVQDLRKIMSKHMVSNGFNDWTYTQCLNYFGNAFQLYLKVFDFCVNK
jgi:hypothetical protein